MESIVHTVHAGSRAAKRGQAFCVQIAMQASLAGSIEPWKLLAKTQGETSWRLFFG